MATETLQYSWEAQNAAGNRVRGSARAENPAIVEQRLLSDGLTPLKVKQSGSGLTGEITFRKTPKHKASVAAFRQLATMQSADLSITESLQIMVEQTEDPILKEGFRNVLRDVKTGTSLSEAMRKDPMCFPPVVTNMIHAGEQGGFMPSSLEQIAESLETDADLRSKIKKAMTYPMAIFTLAILIVTGMILFIVPMFAGMFYELGGPDVQLPGPTLLLVALSENMVWIAPSAVVALLVFASWWRKNHYEEWFRDKWDPIKFKIPVFGKLFHEMALTRFCLNLSQLIRAGVHVPEALEVTASTVGNIRMERAILKARDAIMQGNALSPVLGQEPLFGLMVVRMVAVGEKSGNTSSMLENVGKGHRRNVDEITAKLSALIEPLFMAFIAVMVGFIVVAMYMPYLKLTTLIQ